LYSVAVVGQYLISYSSLTLVQYIDDELSAVVVRHDIEVSISVSLLRA